MNRSSSRSRPRRQPSESGRAAVVENPHPAGGRWLPWIAAAGLAGYLVLFYWSEPLHWQPLTFVLLPDVLFRQWTGGSLQRFGVLDRLPLLALAAGLLAVAWLLGRPLLRVLGCDAPLTRLERLVFACGLGLHLLSLWMLATGLAGQLHRPWLVLTPPVLAAAGSLAGELVRWRRGNGRSERPDSVGGSRVERLGPWLLIPSAIVILAGAMLPPWEFDVREYHLQVPKEWYLAGRIDYLPHNIYGNMPLGAEMQALLAMVAWPGGDGWWWGALVGKTVMASCSLLTAVAVYAAGRRFFGPLAGVVGAVIFAATPWVAHVAMAGLNDTVVGYYGLLATYAALLAIPGAVAGSEGQPPGSANAGGPSQRTRGFAALSGLLAGAAVACKYPAVLFFVLPLSVWWLLGPSRGERRIHWRPAAIFVAAVLLSCGLWLGKNWVLTGNPVYPLLNSWFTAAERPEDPGWRSAEQEEQWRRAHQVPRDAEGRSYTLVQAAASLRTVGWSSRWLSPTLVPLALLSAAASWRWRRRDHWQVIPPLLGLLVFTLAAWWLATHRIERFLVPLLPIAALLAGAGGQLSAARVWKGLLATLLLLTVLSSVLVTSSRLFPADNRFLMALDEFRPDLPHPADHPQFAFTDPAHVQLNRLVRPGSKALLIGDAQPFDLEVDAVYNTCFDRSQLERLLGDARSAAARREALRSAGISHVYVKWSEIDRYRSPGNYGFPPFVTRQLIRDELVERQQVLQPLPLPVDPEQAELFEVRGRGSGDRGR